MFVLYGQIIIQGLANLNRAVHEDVVAVEVLPESAWAPLSSVVLLDDEDKEEEEVEKEEEKENRV